MDNYYKSTNKKTIEKEHLVLRSAFQNDYFHQSVSDGHFLVELEGLDILEDRYAHTPLNISIVIDRSGSMSGDKIKNAKKLPIMWSICLAKMILLAW